MAPRLTKDLDGDKIVDQVGLNMRMHNQLEEHPGILWKTMVLQKGGHIIQDGRFELSHPALREAYDTIQTLRATHGVVEDERGFKKGCCSIITGFKPFV